MLYSLARAQEHSANTSIKLKENIEQAIAHSIKHAPEVIEAKMMLKKAQAELLQHQSKSKPQVDLSVFQGQGHSEQQFNGLSSGQRNYQVQNNALNIKHAWFNPVHSKHTQQMLLKQQKAELNIKATEQQLMSKLAQLWLGVGQAREELMLQELKQDLANTQYEEVLLKLQVGDISQLAYEQQKVEQQVAKLAVVKASQQLQNMMFELKQLMPAFSETVFVQIDQETNLLNQNAVFELPAHEWGFQDNFAIKQLVLDKEMADVELKKLDAQRLPTVDGIYRYSQSESDDASLIGRSITQQVAGIQLNVPLYRGGESLAIEQSIGSEMEKIDAEHQKLNLTLQREVHEIINRYQMNQIALQTFEQAIRNAQQQLQAEELAFSLNLSDHTKILQKKWRWLNGCLKKTKPEWI